MGTSAIALLGPSRLLFLSLEEVEHSVLSDVDRRSTTPFRKANKLVGYGGVASRLDVGESQFLQGLSGL